MWDVIEASASVLLLIVGFVFVLILAYWVTKQVGKRYGGGAASSGYMKVLDRFPIGQDRMLCIVQVADKTLLIGVSPQNIQVLSELDICQLHKFPTEQMTPSFSNVFSDALKKWNPKKTPNGEEEQQNADDFKEK